MARTDRCSTSATPTNVQALDNLNLDDMFDEGGEDIFDGLDIDLGNMDEITGGGAFLTADFVTRPLPAPNEEPASPDSSSLQRRTTKRKSKAPSMFEDDDEAMVAGPPKKKKKGAKSLGKGQKTSGVAFYDEVSIGIQGDSKLKKATGKSPGSVAIVRTSLLDSTVAAAGQFGRRAGTLTLPKKRTKPSVRPEYKSKPSSHISIGTHDPAAITSATLSTLRQVLASHPGLQQSAFRGLSPSSTIFYPFLPSLPSDLAMKSRKVYVFLEKIQSAFTSIHSKSSTDSVTAAVESDAIFKLLQEAFRETAAIADPATSNTANRIDMIGNAIGVLRHTVASFDRTKLVGDFYALCELLNRQHDFLKQNLENMEKWCKNNFDDEDYASVYVPPQSKKRKASGISEDAVLKSFNKRLLKVRVACIGFKEPKSFSLLQALLPMQYVPIDHDSASYASSPKTKKKKMTDEILKQSKNCSSALVAKEQALAYTDCKPSKRRQLITGILSRAARELEMRFQQRVDDRDQIVRRQEIELKKMVDEDEIPVVHTAGMWRWIEKSDILANFTKKDIDDRLGVLRQHLPHYPEEKKLKGNRFLEKARADSSFQSTMDRLTSVLVEENSSDDEFEHEYGVVTESDLSSENELINNDDSLDVAFLSFTERSTMHFEMLGLRAASASLRDKSHHFSNLAERDASSTVESDVDSVLRRMNSDLCHLESLNACRAAFLESLACSPGYSLEGNKRRRDEEGAIIARSQQLVKKNRENKLKPGKVKATQDDLLLPW